MTETTVEQPARPAAVSNAVKLLYATLGIGVLRAALEFRTIAQPASVTFIFLIWVIVFGLMWFLIYKIGSRRNWARITFLVLFVVGIPFSILPLLRSLSATPLSGLVGIAQMIGQIIALAMLFQRSSTAWFRNTKAV